MNWKWTVVLSMSLFLGGCLLRAADYLPSTGAYELRLWDVDGGSIAQAYSVVADAQSSAHVMTPDSSGLPPICLFYASRVDCQHVLTPLTLGTLFRLSAEGIVSQSGELLLPSRIVLGHEWTVFADGECVLKKRIAAIRADEVTIEEFRVCAGIVAVRGTEVWLRSLGRTEIRSPLGVRSTVRRF